MDEDKTLLMVFASVIVGIALTFASLLIQRDIFSLADTKAVRKGWPLSWQEQGFIFGKSVGTRPRPVKFSIDVLFWAVPAYFAIVYFLRRRNNG